MWLARQVQGYIMIARLGWLTHHLVVSPQTIPKYSINIDFHQNKSKLSFVSIFLTDLPIPILARFFELLLHLPILNVFWVKIEISNDFPKFL